MMQSIAIILICIIVKSYVCSTAVDVDRVEWPIRVTAPASMPSAIVRNGNLVRLASDQQPAQNPGNAIHQPFVNLYANDNGEQHKHKLDESSQPSKHDNDITVMNQAKNNVNDSGNRIQHRQSNDDDDDDEHSDLNGTRMSRAKRQNDQRQDICDMQCVCRDDENFLTVECNFKQVSQSSG